MSLSNLEKLTTKKKKRVGLGHGSGRGKTSGRGTKGQNARGTMPLFFEGGALPLIKRLPFMRGKGKNNVFKGKPIALNVDALNRLPKGSKVDIKTLAAFRLVDEGNAKIFGVKILGNGELSVALEVLLPTSKGAALKIKKAGGTFQEFKE